MKHTRKNRILDRANRAQRQGQAGNAIKLHILASEVKTIKHGPEREAG
jgi:hypothetical protein